VRFYGALNGLAGGPLKSRARDVLDAVGLGDVSRRNSSRFSRGMLQRVGLAQALINEPDLIILDEPTSALDPLARVNVRELLLRQRDAGKTVFLSSHLLSEIELVCDRVAMLNHGRIVRMGRTSDLVHAGGQAEITARGIDINTFVGAVTQDGLVRFTVQQSEQKTALERVWTLGGEIVSVNPLKRSLERIFLDVTAEIPLEGTPEECDKSS
jgi:ABC-2 type transport system ATP-binding protein